MTLGTWTEPCSTRTDLPSFPPACRVPPGPASWPGKRQGALAKPWALRPARQPTSPPARTPSTEGRVQESRVTPVLFPGPQCPEPHLAEWTPATCISGHTQPHPSHGITIPSERRVL